MEGERRLMNKQWEYKPLKDEDKKHILGGERRCGGGERNGNKRFCDV